MKQIGFWALAALLMASCNSTTTQKDEVTYVTHLSKLATPIHLSLGESRVLLTDYFPDASGIQKAELNGKALAVDSLGVLTVSTAPSSPVNNLRVMYKSIAHDIPVFASEKVRYTFSYTASSAKVKSVGIAGSMNGWNYKSSLLVFENGQWTTSFELNPGVYSYRIWEDGAERMDSNNSQTIDNGMGGLNNILVVGNIKAIAPQLSTYDANEKSITAFCKDSLKTIYAYFQNERIEVKPMDSLLLIDIPEKAKMLKRSFIRVYADNGVKRSNDLLVPLAYGHVVMDAAELDRTDLQTNVMYFAMVDRFNDADSTNNFPTVVPDTAGAIAIHPKANTLGGDLKGITQKIKDGYFTRLGINSIWISPITQNTEGAWGLWNKGITSAFSAYHGYWPTSLTRIDRRFGTDADFKELIAVAHENNINVLVDYVAHHVHQEHPLYKQKPDWTTPLYLPDGTMNTEKWDEHRLTTWFDTFLPTWNFEKPEVVDALTDTAMYWVKNYDLDGFRHDATKHIREEFWRSLTRKIKTQIPEKNLFQIGETYGNPELISSYISSGMMDAQFDFNLYDASVDAFAKSETDFSRLAEVLLESLHYYGHHHVMGNITGNQDRARFASYADGGVRFDENPKLAGWTREIKNQGSAGFERMEMLTAFLMTTPGIPCIYYGDELGMPGGNDPDNRRMMFFDNLSAEQENLRKAVTQLANLRRSHLALQYGDLKIVQMDPKFIVMARNYFGKAVFVVFHKMKKDEPITFTIPNGIKESKWNSIHGSKSTQSGRTITLAASAKGYDILH